MLEELGFSRDADVVYSRLVTCSPASGAALTELCDLPSATIEGELRNLAAAGMVKLVEDGEGEAGSQFAAISPEFAVEALIQVKEEGLRAARVAVQRLMPAYWNSRDVQAARLVEVVDGSENVRRAIEQVHMIAQSEIRGLTRPPYLHDPTAPNQVAGAKLAHSVRYRSVWDRSALDLPGVFETIRRDLRRGEDARVFSGVPIKLYVADDRMAVVPVTRLDVISCDALIVHPSELLTALSAMFELIWRQARPVGAAERVTEADAGPNADDRKLLDMLGAGMTDESIARSLGCSVRTVQRHVRAVMDQLGAETRIQAGAAAAKRGWL